MHISYNMRLILNRIIKNNIFNYTNYCPGCYFDSDIITLLHADFVQGIGYIFTVSIRWEMSIKSIHIMPYTCALYTYSIYGHIHV